MRRSVFFFLALAACTEKRPPQTPVAASSGAPPDAAPAAPAADPGADEGSFTITANGKPAGEETFKITTGDDRREITTHTVFRQGDAELSIDGSLVLDHAFVPQSGKIERAAGKEHRAQTLERKDGVLQLLSEGKEPIVDRGKSDLFIDNLIPSHLAPLCSLAGTEDKELKIFPGTRLALSRRSTLQFDTQKGPRALDLVAFQAPGSPVVEVGCDGEKLALVRQPAAGIVATREGYAELAELLAEAENNKPKLPEGLVEQGRKVQSPAAGGAVLACSLVMPEERRSPLPAVVLVGAQGPHDRDEDTVGVAGVKTALLGHLAIALGQSGVASLRCDDRGVGESSGSQTGLVLGAFATDVAAQVAALRREPGIDGDRVGILGHGEGATLAQLVAAEDHGIHAIALLSPMGRTLDAISLDQRELEMRRLGVKEDIIRAERKRMAAVYLAIRTGKPPPKGTPDETVAALAPMLPYLASHFRFDPVYTAKKVKAAVLIAHGGKDTVIPPSDGKLVRAHYQKARNPKVTRKLYPDLNHFFTPVAAGTAEDFSDPSLSVDPAFLGDVVTFLSASL